MAAGEGSAYAARYHAEALVELIQSTISRFERIQNKGDKAKRPYTKQLIDYLNSIIAEGINEENLSRSIGLYSRCLYEFIQKTVAVTEYGESNFGRANELAHACSNELRKFIAAREIAVEWKDYPAHYDDSASNLSSLQIRSLKLRLVGVQDALHGMGRGDTRSGRLLRMLDDELTRFDLTEPVARAEADRLFHVISAVQIAAEALNRLPKAVASPDSERLRDVLTDQVSRFTIAANAIDGGLLTLSTVEGRRQRAAADHDFSLCGPQGALALLDRLGLASEESSGARAQVYCQYLENCDRHDPSQEWLYSSGTVKTASFGDLTSSTKHFISLGGGVGSDAAEQKEELGEQGRVSEVRGAGSPVPTNPRLAFLTAASDGASRRQEHLFGSDGPPGGAA